MLRYAHSVTTQISSNTIFSGPEGKKCPTDIKLNERGQEFTCEFTTSTVGEHSIEIVVGEKRLDNVTSKFYTYDASKISFGSIPPGFVGMPVEFESKFNYLLISEYCLLSFLIFCKTF